MSLSQHPLSMFCSLSPLPRTPSPLPPGEKGTTSGLNPQGVVWAPLGFISSTRSYSPCSKHVRLIQSRYKVVERSRDPEVQAAGASGRKLFSPHHSVWVAEAQGPRTCGIQDSCRVCRPAPLPSFRSVDSVLAAVCRRAC